jgi:DNA processing protein
MERQEIAAWLRLLLTPGVGQSTARALLAAFGLPNTVFDQSEAALSALVSRAQAEALSHEPAALAAALESTWAWLNAAPDRRRLLTLGDPLYPQILLQTEDPPLVLWAMGAPWAWSENCLNAPDHICLAVVGSRNPSPQGAANARAFAKALAQAGLTIVSGLALGVDGSAHEGALAGAAENKLATVAFVGTGLDRVYPSRHGKLAHRIAEQGLLLSEYALGTPPLAANFPRRNRLISGLSRGTLVVEAALQSGSLITARMACEQGRDVFAIPGSIHATLSHGCHALIKQGAKLVESAEDVLEELALEKTPGRAALAAPNSPQSRAPTGTPESALLRALGHDPVSLDSLQARCGLPTADLLAQLMTLEIAGQVTRLPGGLFQRMAQA